VQAVAIPWQSNICDHNRVVVLKEPLHCLVGITSGVETVHKSLKSFPKTGSNIGFIVDYQ
jgi:hypothetical protein